MDSSSYGRLVERGGYATGGFVGERGPEIVWASGVCYLPAAGLVSRSDTSVTIVMGAEAGPWPAALLQQLMGAGRIRVFPPDDGTAGVPAKV